MQSPTLAGDDDADLLYCEGAPFWTTRELFEKFMDEQDQDSSAAFEYAFSTPAATRDHFFSLFGDGGLAVPIYGQHDAIFVSMSGGVELHLSNHPAGSPVPAGVKPYDITLMLLDRRNTEDRTEFNWRTFSFNGTPFSMVTEDWILPAQLGELCAMLQGRFDAAKQ